MPSHSESRIIVASCLSRSGFPIRGAWLLSCLFLFLLLLRTVVFAQEAGSQSVPVPLKVLRYRNTTTGAHTFTTDPNAKQSLPLIDSQETGDDLTSDSPFFYLYTQQNRQMAPVYRFQNTNGAMIFAATQGERQVLLQRGMREVSDPAYVYSTKVEGPSEVYRVKNSTNGDVVYTTSNTEKQYYLAKSLIQLSSLGFTQSTSSSGTGILLDHTIKLDAVDLKLVARNENNGQRIIFSGSNSRIASIHIGTVLYSEKSATFRLGWCGEL